MENQNRQRSSQDMQDRSHNEGQQQNIATNKPGRQGGNRSQEISDINNPSREQQAGCEKNSSESESERANKNEDQHIRGGNSSI